jgi:hypothetical protein
LRNAYNNNNSRLPTLGEASSQHNNPQQQPSNLEQLINQLHQFDNRPDDDLKGTSGGVYIADISLTSSQGMSSFLQDFDLGVTNTIEETHTNPNSNKLAEGVFEMNYRTQ